MTTRNDRLRRDLPHFPSERAYGLDWLRAVAAVLVVLLHAGIPYMLAPLPGLAWPVHDLQPSPFVDALCWWINGWVMPAFFLMGGFVAAGLMLQKGPRPFLAHRVRRLLVPFLFGCLVVLPLDLYVWLFGWFVHGRIPLRKLQSLKLDDSLGDNLWGVSHLWFLQYLLVFCLAAYALHVVGRRCGFPSAAAGRFLTANAPRTAMLLVPFALAVAVLWHRPDIVIGFRHSWLPLPENLLYYAPCFGFGWLMFHSRAAGANIASGCELRVAASLAAFFVVLPCLRSHCLEPATGFDRLLMAAGFSAFAWLSATGWFGVFVKSFSRRPPRAVRSLAEASCWVYLIHHPFVALAQIDLATIPMPAGARFALSAAAGLSISLLTYHVFVRDTGFGRLLLGRPARPATAPEPAVVEKALPHPVRELRAA